MATTLMPCDFTNYMRVLGDIYIPIFSIYADIFRGCGDYRPHELLQAVISSTKRALTTLEKNMIGSTFFNYAPTVTPHNAAYTDEYYWYVMNEATYLSFINCGRSYVPARPSYDKINCHIRT